MARRETVAQAYQRGYDDGIAASKAVIATVERNSQVSARTHQLELMKAVTQLISVGGQTIQSLAQVYDNGPRS